MGRGQHCHSTGQTGVVSREGLHRAGLGGKGRGLVTIGSYTVVLGWFPVLCSEEDDKGQESPSQDHHAPDGEDTLDFVQSICRRERWGRENVSTQSASGQVKPGMVQTNSPQQASGINRGACSLSKVCRGGSRSPIWS